MKLLAIDTSSRILSVAVCDNNKITAKSRCILPNGHSSMLVSLIEKVLGKAGLCLKELDAFGVSIGPGSFTGLRVGVTVVKGLSYAVGKPVVPVPTLDVIARNVKRADKGVCVICDARRGMVYSLLYGNLSLVNVEDMLRKIKGRTLFIGDGIRVYRARIEEYCNGRFLCEFADERLWFPKAENVARIAVELLKEGRTAEPFSLVPLYLHPKDCSVVKGRETKMERMLRA